METSCWPLPLNKACTWLHPTRRPNASAEGGLSETVRPNGSLSRRHPVHSGPPFLRYRRGTSKEAMEFDQNKVDEVVLALLWLTAFEVDEYGARAWKSHDWDALDRLHEKGYISDPKSKAKSVVLTEEGMARARELFERHFGRKG